MYRRCFEVSQNMKERIAGRGRERRVHAQNVRARDGVWCVRAPLEMPRRSTEVHDMNREGNQSIQERAENLQCTYRVLIASRIPSSTMPLSQQQKEKGEQGMEMRALVSQHNELYNARPVLSPETACPPSFPPSLPLLTRA